MTCLTVKSDLYLKSNKILSFQINSEDIGALRQAIYRLIWKTYFQYKANLQRIACSTFGSSAGTIRAVPDTVQKVPGLAPVLIF